MDKALVIGVVMVLGFFMIRAAVIAMLPYLLVGVIFVVGFGLYSMARDNDIVDR